MDDPELQIIRSLYEIQLDLLTRQEEAIQAIRRVNESLCLAHEQVQKMLIVTKALIQNG